MGILSRSMLRSIKTAIQEHLKTMIIAETYFNSQWLSILGRSMLKSMNTSIQDHPKTMLMAEACFNFQNGYRMSEHAEKYEYICPGPSKNWDSSWDVLPFPMIILGRRTLKSMNTSVHNPLRTMLVAGACFNLSDVGACWKVLIHPPRTPKN